MERYRPILILTVGFTIGGAEKLILNICKKLRKFKFIVIVLKKNGSFRKIFEDEAIKTYSLGGKSSYDLRIPFLLNGLVKQLQPAIIHTHLQKANWVGRIIGRINKIPVISSIHTTASYLNPFGIAIEKLTCRLSAVNVCYSKNISIEYTKIIKYPFRYYVYNGIPVEEKHFSRTKWEPQKAIVLSRIDLKQKALLELVEAVALLKHKGMHIFIDIFGDGRDRTLLKENIQKWRVDQQVRLMGFTMNPERLMNKYSTLILPSKFEGLPLAILEAISAGLVVVASNVGGVPEIIEDGVTGYLIDGHSPERIAEAIKRVVAEKERLPEISRAAIKKVRENFNIEKTVSYWRRLYQLLLDNPTPDEATLDQILPHV